jgi:hypothetical protein
MDLGRPAIVLDEGMARWRCPRGYVKDVAVAIALAAVDDRAAGRTFHLAEPEAYQSRSVAATWVDRQVGGIIRWLRAIGSDKILRARQSRTPTRRIGDGAFMQVLSCVDSKSSTPTLSKALGATSPRWQLGADSHSEM